MVRSRPIIARRDDRCAAWRCRAALVLAAAVGFGPAGALDEVPFVTTPQPVATAMLRLAAVRPEDTVLDLGSGDGRIVIAAAAQFGARGLGVELSPELVQRSRDDAARAGVAERAQFRVQDLFETDLSVATVITMYLLPSLNIKLRPKLLDLKPGTRIVSHAFTMDDWQADQFETIDYRTAYLWIIPAKVQGSWQLADGGELQLSQRYQMLSGNVRSNGTTQTLVTGAHMNGDQINFSAGGADYTGKVVGNKIEGTIKGAKTGTWSATRAAPPAAK